MPRHVSALTLRGTPRNLARLAKALQKGELVAVPTETVYGLAGNALNTSACRKIFRSKGRPTHDPLIVHIHHLDQWEPLAQVNDAARKVARAFWPGPLTIVLPKQPSVPDLCTSGLPSVAVRMPAHPLFRALLERCGLPLAAPSANPFGYLSPTTAAHVRDHLGERIPYILDGGPCEIGVESTILDLRRPSQPRLLRPGAISAAALSRVLGVPVKAHASRPAKAGQAAVAPGLLTQHYSPHTPLELHEEGTLNTFAPDVGEVAVLLRKPKGQRAVPSGQLCLSQRGSLAEAAHHLFECLQFLDTLKLTRIHLEVPSGDEPLALAIRDRLTRAAAKR